MNVFDVNLLFTLHSPLRTTLLVVLSSLGTCYFVKHFLHQSMHSVRFHMRKFSVNYKTTTTKMSWPANHPLSQSVDWIAKGAAQRGRTEGAVLPARRSAPEHDPYMTSEHSTTARWIRLRIDFKEGGNRSARTKPSKSGWDGLKLSPHATFLVEMELVIDGHYAGLISQWNTARAILSR